MERFREMPRVGVRLRIVGLIDAWDKARPRRDDSRDSIDDTRESVIHFDLLSSTTIIC